MDFQTPEWLCKLMVGMLPKNCETILEPTPGDGNLVMALREQRPWSRIQAAVQFWDINERYDAIIMNPPFSPMTKGYEILYRCMELSDVIVALMPWLTLINSEKRTQDIFDFGLSAVVHLPRSTFKGSRVQTCVLQLEKGFCGTTSLNLIEHI